MTDMRMALVGLLEKEYDAELMREIISFVAQRSWDLDVESICWAKHGERSTARSNWCNGYGVSTWGYAGRHDTAQNPEAWPRKLLPGLHGVAQVWRLCEEIDERVNAFLERPPRDTTRARARGSLLTQLSRGHGSAE